jgi:hypothetical protein
MNEPLDVRDKAWIDAFTVFRKANLDAWAVYIVTVLYLM